MNTRFPTPDEAIASRFRPDVVKQNNAMQEGYILHLKVLSGPQSGAVHEVPSGRLMIGNDLDCDVVLRSRTTTPFRALMSRLDGSVSITAIAGALQLNEITIPVGETHPVGAGDTLTLGDILFAVSSDDIDWANAVQIPDAPEHVEFPAAPVVTIQQDVPASFPVGAILVVIAFAFVLVAAYQVLSSMEKKSPLVSIAKSSNVSDSVRLTKTLRASGFSNLKVINMDGGSLVIQGYVDTDNSLKRLHTILGNEKIRVTLRVYSAEAILAGARESLEANKLPGALRYENEELTLGVSGDF